MDVLLKLLIAVLIGAVVAWVAGLVLAHMWAVLLGIVAGMLYFFNGPGVADRNV